MIKFENTDSGVLFEYFADNEWVWVMLNETQEVRISKIFSFKLTDLIKRPNKCQDYQDYVYQFQFGVYENNYVRIPARIFDIKNDLLISQDIPLKRSIFAAERNISIFKHISHILDDETPIVIGGDAPDAIPREIFYELLNKFPNTTELNKYSDARVHTILSQYLDGMKDARGSYEKYLKKRITHNIANLDLDAIKQLEIEKYVLIKNLLEDALHNKNNWAEKEWQKLMITFILLLFPKYVMVLENVTIHDYYSQPNNKKTVRYIDIALIDANGNIDIIEIKRPFDDKILRKGKYRGNSIPTAELSGSIMQAEKYLFHLSKWGVKGEEYLNKKYNSMLPPGMSIHISNPKAIVIVGRDQIDGDDMTPAQLLDFQIIKRKYANMMDIITYDDLLRRLEHTIHALSA